MLVSFVVSFVAGQVVRSRSALDVITAALAALANVVFAWPAPTERELTGVGCPDQLRRRRVDITSHNLFEPSVTSASKETRNTSQRPQ